MQLEDMFSAQQDLQIKNYIVYPDKSIREMQLEIDKVKLDIETI